MKRLHTPLKSFPEAAGQDLAEQVASLCVASRKVYTTGQLKKKTPGLGRLEDAMDNMKASFKPNKKSKQFDKVVMRGEKSQKEVALSLSDLLVPFMKRRKKRRVGMNKILLDSKTTVRRSTDI
jgi:hypothetical protein